MTYHANGATYRTDAQGRPETAEAQNLTASTADRGPFRRTFLRVTRKGNEPRDLEISRTQAKLIARYLDCRASGPLLRRRPDPARVARLPDHPHARRALRAKRSTAKGSGWTGPARCGSAPASAAPPAC
ncbi:hypothetical protein AB0C84_42945 [Actinomadura sp. NPDC048955]|uniref:hypothetical protein n=1 Tax=Actinomadura sp. NPDC048955 TaxID=3158228 RepID=UPI0033F2B652